MGEGGTEGGDIASLVGVDWTELDAEPRLEGGRELSSDVGGG